MRKITKKIENAMNINKQIVREVYVKSLQELVLQIEEKQAELEYYKHKNKVQRLTIKKLKNRIRELESKKRRVK